MKYKNLIYHIVVLACAIIFFILYIDQRGKTYEYRDILAKKLYDIHKNDMRMIDSIFQKEKIIIDNQNKILKEIK